jgi:hypothetical protein
MGFKKMGRSLDFADFALSSSMEANRSVKLMEKSWPPLTGPVSKRFSCNITPSAPARKAPKPIRPSCCSSACYCKNGFAPVEWSLNSTG